jgi:hypothetical protein
LHLLVVMTGIIVQWKVGHFHHGVVVVVKVLF